MTISHAEFELALKELTEALGTGQYNVKPSPLVQGQPLIVEDIDLSSMVDLSDHGPFPTDFTLRKAPPIDLSRYPLKCGSCGSPAYQGLGPVMCSNRSCKYAENPRK